MTKVICKRAKTYRRKGIQKRKQKGRGQGLDGHEYIRRRNFRKREKWQEWRLAGRFIRLGGVMQKAFTTHGSFYVLAINHIEDGNVRVLYVPRKMGKEDA